MTEATVAQLIVLVAVITYALVGLALLHSFVAIRRRIAERAARDQCLHPAWRVVRLTYPHGLAVRVSCYRCGCAAGERFATEGLSDGSISIVNQTVHVLNLVVDGELHETLPPAQWSPYEDDVHESTYAVYVQPDSDLRKP